MKKIGMIVAVEIQSVLDKFSAKLNEQKSKAGYLVLEYSTEQYQLIIVSCGAGEIAAASGTQFLISEYHVDMVINFGIVGGLTEEMSKTKVCIVEKVVHYDFDTSTVDNVEVGRYLNYPDIYIPTSPQVLKKAIELNPKLLPVICASGDKFIADPEQKAELHRKFGAQICEMEAAGIILTCNRNEVPCMMIKIISDGITGGVEEFLETKEEAATICLDIVTQIVNEM